MVKKEKGDHVHGWCCCDNGKFPTLAVILLIWASVWLFNELNVINVNLPWIPVILIVVAIGMIHNRYRK